MAVEEYHVHVYTGKEYEEYEIIECKCWLEYFVDFHNKLMFLSFLVSSGSVAYF